MAPKFILARLVEILESSKTEVPSARALTELFGEEMRRHEDDEQSALLVEKLASDQREFLDGLFDKDSDSDSGLIKLTLLKRFSQSTKRRKIEANVEDLRTIRGLFDSLECVIESLDLTQEWMRHCASSVIKARVHQVSRRAQDDRHLRLGPNS